MAENDVEDEVKTIPLVCLATGQRMPVKDVEEHGILYVFIAGEPEGKPKLMSSVAAKLEAEGEGSVATMVNGAITKDAKIINITLKRDEPGGPLYGYAYSTVETFKGITAHAEEFSFD